MSEGRILQLDTPEAIYGRPAHPFVAGFIGDATVLPGRLLARDGGTAQVEAAGLTFTVPAETLGETQPGAAVSLYIRPEHLRPIEEGPGLDGTVISRAYLGDRAELVVECEAAGRLLLRVPGQTAQSRWPVGVPVRVGFDGAQPVAFAI
jgi:putative spermidine/putrescine transport system ATP-binding protein/spermidine/putrescine transport system ATP-binding protein